METLTQTPDTLLDELKMRAAELKNASIEKFEQFAALFQSNATEPLEEVTVETETAVEEVVEAAPEMDLVDHSQPQDDVLESVELAASNGELEVEVLENVELEAITDEVTEEEPATEIFAENGTEHMEETALQEEIDSVFIEGIGEAPKADIEIRLDEIYSIRVVANEVVNSIEELQNEVAALRAQVSNIPSAEELENQVREMVAAALRERFV